MQRRFTERHRSGAAGEPIDLEITRVAGGATLVTTRWLLSRTAAVTSVATGVAASSTAAASE